MNPQNITKVIHSCPFTLSSNSSASLMSSPFFRLTSLEKRTLWAQLITAAITLPEFTATYHLNYAKKSPCLTLQALRILSSPPGTLTIEPLIVRRV